MIVVFHDPVNSIAGQAVSAGECCDAAIFHSAQTALGRGPHSTVRTKLKVAHCAIAQPVRDIVGRADLAVLQVSDSTVVKSEPQAALQPIRQQSYRPMLVSELGPRNALNGTLWRRKEKALVEAADPNLPVSIPGD